MKKKRALSLLLAVCLLAGLLPTAAGAEEEPSAGPAPGEDAPALVRGTGLTLVKGEAAGDGLESDGYLWDGSALTLSGLSIDAAGTALAFRGFRREETVTVTVEGACSLKSEAGQALSAPCRLLVQGSGSLGVDAPAPREGDASAAVELGALVLEGVTLEVPAGNVLSCSGPVINGGVITGGGRLEIAAGGGLFNLDKGRCTLGGAEEAAVRRRGGSVRAPAAGDGAGEGWTWDSLTDTLTLEDGCTIFTDKAAGILVPDDATLKVEGRATVVACGADRQGEAAAGIAMGAGARLALADGARLTVYAAGDALSCEDAQVVSGDVFLGSRARGLCCGDLTVEQGAGLFVSGAGAAEIRGVLSVDGSMTAVGAQGGLLIRAGGDPDIALNVGASGALRVSGGEGGSPALQLWRGGVDCRGSLTVDGAGDGLSGAAPGDYTLAGPVSIRTGGTGILCPGGLTLSGRTLRVESGGTALAADGAITLSGQGGTLIAGEHGASAGDTLTVEAGGALSVSAGGDGLRSVNRLAVDGSVTVDRAAGDGLASTGGSVTVDGAAQIKADGAAIRAARLVTTGEACRLDLEAGDSAVVSGGDTTLNSDPAQVARLTAGISGVVSGGAAVLARPGDLAITAADYGVYAGGDVDVGGAEDDRSHVTIDCGSYSIYSVGGKVSLQACRDAYFFEGNIFTDIDKRMTMNLADGAAVFFGMRSGFAVGIVRKDFTITGAHTGPLLELATLQVGKGYKFTIAADANLKTGPIVSGASAQIVAQPGSKVYYNGLAGVVTGETTAYLDDTLDLTRPDALAGLGQYGDTITWKDGTLTLSGAVIDVRDDCALKLPAGAVLEFGGEPSYLSTGSGSPAVIQCEGDLALSGGNVTLSGGKNGVQAGGSLRLDNTRLKVGGASDSAISAGGDFIASDADLDLFLEQGTGVAAAGRISLTTSNAKVWAADTALAAGGALVTDRTSLNLHGENRAVSGGSISIDGLPEGLTVSGGSVVGDGSPVSDLVTDFSGAGAGAQPGEVVTETVRNPDGSVTTTSTDQDSGVVTAVTARTDGATVTEVRRPDGVTIRTVQTPDGGITAEIQIPEGMERAAASIPVPGAGPGTVALLTGPDGTERVLAKSAVGTDELRVLLDRAEGGVLRIEARSVSFPDVPAEAWFHDPVTFVAARGLFSGVSDRAFDPNGAMSRAMLATVLHRLEGEPQPQAAAPYPDVAAGAWYADGVAWASEQGIVTGTDTGFAPEEPITREQLALMLFRYARTQGLDVDGRSDLARFTDGGAVSPWAAEAVSWAVRSGLLAGSGGALRPGDGASRCEVAAVLQRMLNLMCQA